METSHFKALNDANPIFTNTVLSIQPPQQNTMSITEYLSYFSWALYLMLWSLSFYFQVWETYKRQNAFGLSIEYASLQCCAYFFFSIYGLVSIVELNGATSEIDMEQLNKSDVYFAIHAFMMSAAILSQCLIYPRTLIGDMKQIKQWALVLMGIFGGLIFLSFAVEISIDEGNEQASKRGILMLPLPLQTQMVSGYGLVVTHMAKYIPQIKRNQERKSTVGLNPIMVILDLFGSTFCLLQQIIELMLVNQNNYTYGKSSGPYHFLDRLNLIKFLLAIFSATGDFVFLMQHYLMYREAVVQDKKKKINDLKSQRRRELSIMIDAKLQQIPVFESLNSPREPPQDEDDYVTPFKISKRLQELTDHLNYPAAVQQFDQYIELLDHSANQYLGDKQKQQQKGVF